MGSLVAYAMLLLHNLPAMIRAGADIEASAIAIKDDVTRMVAEDRGPTDDEWHALNQHIAAAVTGTVQEAETVVGALKGPEPETTVGGVAQDAVLGADAVADQVLDPADAAKADEAAMVAAGVAGAIQGS